MQNSIQDDEWEDLADTKVCVSLPCQHAFNTVKALLGAVRRAPTVLH